MNRSTSPPSPLLDQEIEGINGLRLAVFRHYRALVEALRPVEAAARSAMLDGDMHLHDLYDRSWRERFAAIEGWFDCACRLLLIEGIDRVRKAVEDDIARDAAIEEAFAMIRRAATWAPGQPWPAGEGSSPPWHDAGATAPAAGPTPDAAPAPVADPALGAAATPVLEPTPGVAPAPAAQPAPGPRSAPAAQASPPPQPAKNFLQNEMPRRRSLLLNGAGSWTEPLLPRPLTIMGRDVFLYEVDPGDRWERRAMRFEGEDPQARPARPPLPVPADGSGGRPRNPATSNERQHSHGIGRPEAKPPWHGTDLEDRTRSAHIQGHNCSLARA